MNNKITYKKIIESVGLGKLFINSLKRPFVNTDYGYGQWGIRNDETPKYPVKKSFQVGEMVHWNPTSEEIEKYGFKTTIFGNSRTYLVSVKNILKKKLVSIEIESGELEGRVFVTNIENLKE